MNKLKAILLILFLGLYLPSCVQQAQTNRSNNADTSLDGGTDSTPDEAEIEEEIYWFTTTQVEGEITINQSSTNVLYIRGKTPNSYLSINNNINNVYCLAISYNNTSEPALKPILRVRAIPQSVVFTSTNTVENYFRIDLNATAQNSSQCSGTVTQYLTQTATNGTTTDGAYDLATLCPTCTSKISSAKVQLYQVATNSISESSVIGSNEISFDSLSLRVDFTNNSSDTGSGGSCSESACQAQGRDCCIDGQCVTDGELRTNPNQDDLVQALADVQRNSSNYIKWPSVYYVCGSGTPNIPDPDTPNPDDDAQQRITELTLKYNCLQGASSTPADYTNCQPNGDTSSYQAIRSEVWALCGCTVDNLSGERVDPRCPDYGLELVVDSSGATTDVICSVPTVTDPNPPPFQDLEVYVSTRSVPHRFFNTDGVEFESIDQSTKSQEGEEFSYFDEVNKTGAISTNFSMNAILGQMSTSLDKALPAKVIDIDLNKNYSISVNSGFYTPCPDCAKDKWFKLFLPHPTSSYGNGVTADPVTTSRTKFGFNSDTPNYEDNIFGRACFVPPTMIPFSHREKSDLQTQRIDRLQTQAAYYVNGYQRDWYGFNKGAVIGSFDGVTWFAIGSKGRLVRSTSKKLYITINAAFADLADNSAVSVMVKEDQGLSTIPQYDFNPDLAINDTYQNSAGTCQRYHMCNTDSDCVSQLGWEYTCADVSAYKSYLPRFNSTAQEQVGNDIETDFNKIIFGGYDTSHKRRCVYRGAGAPCKVDYNSDGLTDQQKELFTCAPNFYCAALNDSGFNKEVVREKNSIFNILYGQDTDVLGRPLNYVGGSGDGVLSSNIKENIVYNAALFFGKDTSSTGANNFGLCRPGKNLGSTTWLDQHSASDSSKRTDYINQIASCDSSSIVQSTRVASCPSFDSDGNYNNDTATSNERIQQNMCGSEWKDSNNDSVFNTIEGDSLNIITALTAQTLTKDACLRKAGSVCNTDLDCGPNRLHKEQALFLDQANFGDTLAEYLYWQEELVCGQAVDTPTAGTDAAINYDLTQNRCCREIGSTLTMYTAGSHLEGNTLNTKLNTANYNNSGDSTEGRYSRYTVANAEDIIPNQTTPQAQIPTVTQNAVPKGYQWKSFNDTARRTCCGAGWVRKFADGSNNWTIQRNLSMNIESFKCLNYDSPLYKEKLSNANESNYQKDKSKLCLYAGENDACIQTRMPAATGFELQYPSNTDAALALTVTLDTSIESQFDNLSRDIPYMPTPWKTPTAMNSTNELFNYFEDGEFDRGLSIYLPAYIDSRTAIDTISITYYDSNNDVLSTVPITGNEASAANCDTASANNSTSLAAQNWCVDTVDGYEILHAHAGQANVGGVPDYTNAGLVITFRPYRTIKFNSSVLNQGATVPGNEMPMNPGNDLYYSTKLSRFELAGIPQVLYEPIYCNDNRENLVPGLFDVDTRTDVEGGAGFDYDLTNQNPRSLKEIYNTNFDTDESNPSAFVMDSTRITQTPIFSENEFKCCVSLGQTTSAQSNCCTNFGTQNQDGSFTCKIPSGTNLMVFFNRFVSGEGIGEDQPGGGLVDTDFVLETGEPKLTQEVYNKIRALGNEYCSNGTTEDDDSTSTKTRNGAAFGEFTPEPNNGGFIGGDGGFDPNAIRYNSIIDSANDDNADSETGTGYFFNGYRWSHHIYCQ